MLPLTIGMSSSSAACILGCDMHHLKGERGEVTELKLSGNCKKKVLEDSFQGLNKLRKINLDRNQYQKAIAMPHDLCKKVVESEDEAFANLANPRELLADANHLCKIPAGFPLPLPTLNLGNNCISSVSNNSFSTCTLEENQPYNNS